MYRVRRAIHAAFLAAILIAFVRVSAADSRLSLQCKNIARDVIINSCKGPRIKRDTQRMNLEMLDEQMSKIDPTEASADMEPGVVPQKRQYFPQRFGPGYGGPGYGGPGMLGGIGLPATNIAANSFQETQFHAPGIGYMESQDTAVQESFLPQNPYRPFGSYPVRRSIKTDELTDFDLNSDELEELYDEVGDRLPRSSKDLTKKIFQTVATKCCPNPKLCYDNPNVIPCMGY